MGSWLEHDRNLLIVEGRFGENDMVFNLLGVLELLGVCLANCLEERSVQPLLYLWRVLKRKIASERRVRNGHHGITQGHIVANEYVHLHRSGEIEVHPRIRIDPAEPLSATFDRVEHRLAPDEPADFVSHNAMMSASRRWRNSRTTQREDPVVALSLIRAPQHFFSQRVRRRGGRKSGDTGHDFAFEAHLVDLERSHQARIRYPQFAFVSGSIRVLH